MSTKYTFNLVIYVDASRVQNWIKKPLFLWLADTAN